MLLTGAGEANQAAETAHVLRWAKLKHSKNREPDICLWFVSWKRDVTVIAIACFQGAKARGWSSTRNISRLLLSPSSSFSRSQSPRRRRTGSPARRRRRSATRGRRGRRRGSRRGGRCLGEASCSAQERNLWRNCQTWWPEPEQRFIITAMKKWHLTTNQMISVGSSLPPTRSHSILPPRFHSSRRQRRERHATCRGGRRGRRFFFIFINFFIIVNFNGNFYIVMPCHQFSDIHHCHQLSPNHVLEDKVFCNTPMENAPSFSSSFSSSSSSSSSFSFSSSTFSFSSSSSGRGSEACRHHRIHFSVWRNSLSKAPQGWGEKS